MSGRVLVVNADDFGFTRGVNLGIIEAHTRGILTAATLMANGAAFDHAVGLAQRHPSLDVGCHLVLAGGRAVLPPHPPLPRNVRELLVALMRGRLNVEAELDAQIRKILAAGLAPTHLDTHKHTHLLPPVLDAVARLSERYGIRWVRRPFDFPIEGAGTPRARRLVSRGLGFLRGRFHRVLTRHGCRTTDHFAGFAITGLYRTAELAALIGRLPEGSTELMTHPGRCTDELRGAATRLKESRERELEALTAPETRAAIEARGVRLAGFGDL